jgi:hypothetical protein
MAYTLIQRTVLSSPAISIEIANIPQTFKHLWVVTQFQFSQTPIAECFTRINSNSGSVYYCSAARFNGTGISQSASQNTYIMMGPDVPNTENAFKQFITIPDYTSSAKKSILFQVAGKDQNFEIGGCFFDNTSPVTSLLFLRDTSRVGNWTTNSEVTVWGIS